MKFNKSNPLDIVLNALVTPYQERVKDVVKINEKMIEKGLINKQSDIVNDHVAFRTLGIEHLGIKSFEKIFLHYGYRKMSYYNFENKKLDAYWYAPPSSYYPRIFVSEIRVKDLSLNAQKTIEKYTKHITQDPVDQLDLDDAIAVGGFFNKPLWEVPTIKDYKLLLEESEYAAWVIYNRYYLNHYTISVHELPNGYNKLEAFNRFLESIGIVLNSSGGVIKTSKDGLLRQSSSVAKMIEATFADGEQLKIAGSYVEFAERLVLPQYKNLPKDEIKTKHRREGFESANADKIFESTYRNQTGRTSK